MKNLRIESDPGSALVRIAFEGGGEVPDMLKGLYTSPADAQRAIEVWKASGGRDVEVKVQADEDERKAQEAKKNK